MARLLILVAACACLAQNPSELFDKAPPAVDAALRARIMKFYQYAVEGKFRPAEALVAEDTKDFYYSSSKPKYLGCEISRIEYSHEFTRAKATMVCETYVPIMGFADKPVKVPFGSRWKLENGEWFWYVDPEELAMTPFGRMKAGGSAARQANLSLANTPSVQTVMSAVTADRSSVRLKRGGKSAEQVTFANRLPGSVNLSVDTPPVPGIQAALDKSELKANDKAVLTLEASGGKSLPPAINIIVRVQQTNQVIPIMVQFSDK